ncbi:MAG: 3-deoxy-D-manno-octulosonic acid transferase [Bacteroidia bacterium]
MRSLYTISVRFYHTAIRIASLFNTKAKLFVDGRRDVFSRLKSSRLRNPDSRLIWFHCASLGEFEQGRPLIEKYRGENPADVILLTFFSPSGYEIRKNYPGADIISYLPVDTPVNARKFLDAVRPSAAFFVKYEFWFNYLSELKNRKIPTYLVSGIFREDHHFFKSTGGWFRKQLGAFTYFFLQDERSQELLNSIGYKNTMVSGDTRFDRVSEVVKNVKEFAAVKKFSEGKKTLVAGSTWPEDEKLISDFRSQLSDFKIIIAPHEIHEAHLKNIEALFPGCIRYSNANEHSLADTDVLLIDNIGILSSLYQYGTIAFIGGGFGKGIHNILEAAAFGMPVIFGPNYRKFEEAKDLVKLGGAFEVADEKELGKAMQLLADEQVLKTAAQISKMYVQGKKGASAKILAALGRSS